MFRFARLALAATALAGLATGANAQHTTSQTTFSDAGIAGLGTSTGDWFFGALQNPNTTGSIGGNPTVYTKANSGSRFHQEGTAPDNTEAASESVANSFTLTGSVTKDCSFYGGGQTGHTINLGTIGVRTGNNDNVSIAFNQRDAVTANVNSATAGCNTNNTVTIAKTNGSDGLRNFTPGSYDSNQFTDRIPYTVDASWTGVATGSTAAGTTQTLAVAANQGTNNKSGGAWRSAFNMDVNAPAQSKGLVAGTYTDTITVTLAAI